MNRTLKGCAIVLLIALLGTAMAPGQASKGKQQKPLPQDDQGGTIRVAVEMVSLPVVVTTRDGRRVTDLEQKDFKVFEDGLAQEIVGFAATDEPVTLVLIIDTSGSTEQQLARMQDAAIDFVNQLHPDDSVAIMSFADDVQLQNDFTIDRDRNAYGIKKTRPGGMTVLYEAVWLGLEEVLKPVKERKAMVLFTDGVDTASRKASQKETIELARESSATIYSVYYNTEWDMPRQRTGPTGIPTIINPYPPMGGGRYPGGYPGSYPGGQTGDYAMGRRYLEQLAEETGGRMFDTSKTDDLPSAFEQVARELASQYSIGYYSTNPKQDGKFRKIDVRVSKPELAVRTKKGYYTRKPGRK